MKIVFSLVSIFFSLSALAEGIYFESFVGKYDVKERKCAPSEALCETVNVVQLSLGDEGQWILRESDPSGKTFLQEMVEQETEDTLSYFRGDLDYGSWTRIVKDSTGKTRMKESLSFSTSLQSSSRDVRFQYWATFVDKNTGEIRSSWRVYKLSRK